MEQFITFNLQQIVFVCFFRGFCGKLFFITTTQIIIKKKEKKDKNVKNTVVMKFSSNSLKVF